MNEDAKRAFVIEMLEDLRNLNGLSDFDKKTYLAKKALAMQDTVRGNVTIKHGLFREGVSAFKNLLLQLAPICDFMPEKIQKISPHKEMREAYYELMKEIERFLSLGDIFFNAMMDSVNATEVDFKAHMGKVVQANDKQN